ncbi:hypothetical protein BH11ARM2_BH11ARM2_32010 [soil metagenome]
MLAVEGATQIVCYANPAIRRLLGREESDLLGRRFDEVVPEGAARRFSEALDRVLATGTSEQVVEEERGLGVAGVPYTHWSLSIWAIRNADDGLAGAMIQVTDLSEIAAFRKDSAAINEALLLSALREHESREEAEISNERLSGEIAQRIASQEALRQFVALLETRVQERTVELEMANRGLQSVMSAIAHNLRAPLRAIVSTSKILVEDSGDRLSPSQTDLLARQVNSAMRMSSLIDDLLDYARLAQRSLALKSVDLTALAHGVADRLAIAGRPVDLVVEEGLVAEADQETVKIALFNLIDNAAKFSPQGGVISVGRLEGKEGSFFVRDEGIGFDMAYAAKLFEPFERLVGESEFPGNGIGLAKAKRIVELYGGTIWAESSVGHGSTFFFTLESRKVRFSPS